MAGVLKHRGLDGELGKTLQPNENVLAVAQTGQQAMVATNLRVIILKSAAAIGKMFGGGLVSSYQYQHITNIETRKQLMSSMVIITVAGVPVFGSDGKSPNTFPYGKLAGGADQEVEQVVGVIRQQITQAQSGRIIPQQAAPISQPLPNIPEQIKQLAALRDAGVLTPQEFEQKKAELLSRM